MIEKIYKFSCADCPTKAEYPNKDAAKAFGWAIAHNGKDCYCPRCAPNHRNTGPGGAKSKIACTNQISIEEVKDSA